MTTTLRIRLILALAIVFYAAVIAAGTGGFAVMVWVIATLLFIVWHLAMHDPSPPAHWPFVLLLHGVIAALCLGIGHALGVVSGLAGDPLIALSVAFGVTGIARIIDRAAGIDAAVPEESQRDRGEGR